VKKMWKLILLLILAIVLAAVTFSLCKENAPSNNGGGKTDNTDPDAPKIIHSTEITSIECSFTTANALNTSRLGKRFYRFEAVLQNGKVTGSYRSEIPSSPDETVSVMFETDDTFMTELQSISTEHGIAKYNGISIRVGGLPPKLGSRLYIAYASGEQISAANNQSNFLTIAEMEALESLFYKTAFEKTKEDKNELYR